MKRLLYAFLFLAVSSFATSFTYLDSPNDGGIHNYGYGFSGTESTCQTDAQTYISHSGVIDTNNSRSEQTCNVQASAHGIDTNLKSIFSSVKSTNYESNPICQLYYYNDSAQTNGTPSWKSHYTYTYSYYCDFECKQSCPSGYMQDPDTCECIPPCTDEPDPSDIPYPTLDNGDCKPYSSLTDSEKELYSGEGFKVCNLCFSHPYTENNCPAPKILTPGDNGMHCVSNLCPPLPKGVISDKSVSKENCNADYFEPRQPNNSASYFLPVKYDVCRSACTYKYVYCPSGQRYEIYPDDDSPAGCKVPQFPDYSSDCNGSIYEITKNLYVELDNKVSTVCKRVLMCNENGNVTELSSRKVSCGDGSDLSSNDTNQTKTKDKPDTSKNNPCDEKFDKVEAMCQDGKVIGYSDCQHNGLTVTNDSIRCVSNDFIEPQKPSDCSWFHEKFNYQTQACECESGYSKNTFGDCWKSLDSNATSEEKQKDLQNQEINNKEKNARETDTNNTNQALKSSSNMENSLSGIRSDLNTTNGLLSKILGKDSNGSGSSNNYEPTTEQNQSLNSSFTNLTGFLNDTQDSLNGVKSQFDETKALINSGFTYTPPAVGSCVNPRTTIEGKNIELNICEPIQKFSPVFYLVFTIIFTFVAIKIFILGFTI